jgi:hypothetical protein
MDAAARRADGAGALMATILNSAGWMPTRSGGLPSGPLLTTREAAALRAAPKRSPSTEVTVRAYPVKIAGVPLLGLEHMYTEYDDGRDQYISRGGPSWHGLHAQVDPARESPDYRRGTRVVHQTELPGLAAAEAVWPARRNAVRVEASHAPYAGLYSNSNSVVGDQMEDQFGHRVGDRRTPGWNHRIATFPERLRQAPYSMVQWTGEGVRP